MRRWGWVLMIAVLLPTAYYGCSPSSDTGGPGGGDIQPTSPDNLLLFFSRAYRDKVIEDYDDALDENFLFQFTPDIADSLGLPEDEPWWGKTADVNSARTLFESPSVTDILFTYDYQVPWYTCIEERIGGTDEDPDTTRWSGFCCRLDPLIEVTTIVEDQEDPILKLRVDGSWLDVTVIPDPNVEGLWTILRIVETKKLQ